MAVCSSLNTYGGMFLVKKLLFSLIDLNYSIKLEVVNFLKYCAVFWRMWSMVLGRKLHQSLWMCKWR